MHFAEQNKRYKVYRAYQIEETTRITAVAFARAGTPFKSKFTYLDYYILKDGESEFIVDSYNCLKAYLGNIQILLFQTQLTVLKYTE